MRPDRDRRPPACSRSWLELPGAADRLASWSQSSGLDLARLGTTATAEEITDTAVTQPLVVAATLLAYEELTKRGLLAGRRFHRRRTLRRRDRRLRDRRRDLRRRRRRAGRHPRRRDGQGLRHRAHRHVRGARRRRGRGAGPPRGARPGARQPQRRGPDRGRGRLAALDKLAEDPPAKARVRQLATAGAFHTQLHGVGHSTATPPRRQGVATAEPTATLLSNADGQPVASAADAMTKLVAQLTRPVRWDLCTETHPSARDVTAIVEFPPAGTLAGIAKRELRGVPTHAVKIPRRPGRARPSSRADSAPPDQRQPHRHPNRSEVGAQQQYDRRSHSGRHQEEIIAGLAEIIEEVTGIEPSEVTPEKSFVDDLDIDSLSMVEIAVQTEDKYGVKIPDEDLAGLRTVGDVVAYIQKLEEENPEAAAALREKFARSDQAFHC